MNMIPLSGGSRGLFQHLKKKMPPPPPLISRSGSATSSGGYFNMQAVFEEK